MAFFLQTKSYLEANSFLQKERNSGGGGVKGSVEVQALSPQPQAFEEPYRESPASEALLQRGEVGGSVAGGGALLESCNETQTQVQAP